MAELAIKGHPSRGKEVIQLLEMLGGVNKHQIGAIRQTYVYFIDIDNIIRLLQINQLLPEKDIVYSLEEFEEKYPYKVGDKVILDEIPCIITWMCWECNNIYYQVQGIGDVFTKKVTADELKLYKERNNMGNKLAIKGHATRGKEVIQLLEMLGGTNDYFKHDGKIESFYYYIGNFNNNIYQCGLPYEMKCFELEEFLEKYPYKVGDEVEYKSIADANLKSKIIYMEWCNSLNKVLYTTEDAHVISTEDIIETKSIPLYMDYDIKEDKDMSEHTTEINLNHPCFDGHDKIELIIPENWKFEQIDNKMFGIRKYPQYPKTYEECCEVLNLGEDGKLWTKGYKASLIQDFQKLLICRDAYWKIAGERMGLDKPWEPDWGENDGGYRYCIRNQSNKIVLSNEWLGENYILSFPTEEMRDAFYNNFNNLIEQCKELL